METRVLQVALTFPSSLFSACACVCAPYPNGAMGYVLLGGSVSSSFHGVGCARSRVQIQFSLPSFCPYLFETSLLSKVCGPWTVVAGCAQITGSRPLWVSVWLGSVTGDEGTAPRLSVCSQAPVPPRPDSWGRLKLVTHPSGPQFLHL